MNNRKQQIESFLDSLTLKEISTYLKDKEINKENLRLLEILEKHKGYKGKANHQQQLVNQIYSNINDMYLLGEANIIAAILYYGLHKDFNIKDFVKVYDGMLKDDFKLKEYVYEIMKDLD